MSGCGSRRICWVVLRTATDHFSANVQEACANGNLVSFAVDEAHTVSCHSTVPYC